MAATTATSRSTRRDSAAGMPKSVVIEPAFSWGDDRPPRTPWHDTVIYEAHVRGLTMLPSRTCRRALRGTYAGAGRPPRHRATCKDLGITAIELMPVHHSSTTSTCVDRGLRNYWGYNTIGFFAPDAALRSARTPGAQVSEFKTMVKTLHDGGHRGHPRRRLQPHRRGQPARARRSPSAASTTRSYYRLVPDDQRYYMDYTGTGNTLNMLHPRTLS